MAESKRIDDMKKTKAKVYLFLLLISLLAAQPKNTVGSTLEGTEVTKNIIFSNLLKGVNVEFQLRFFNDSQSIEFTSIDFDASLTDVVEVQISGLVLNVEKFSDSLQNKGSVEITKDADLVFAQTGISKNLSWGHLSYSNVHYLKIDFDFTCKIIYELFFISLFIPYNESVETTSSINDILFEVTPASDISLAIFLGEGVIVISALLVTIILYMHKFR